MNQNLTASDWSSARGEKWRTGIGHLSSGEALSWAAFARRVAALADLPAARIEAVPHARLALGAPRPPYAALASERGWTLPALEDALSRWFAALDRTMLRA